MTSEAFESNFSPRQVTSEIEARIISAIEGNEPRTLETLLRENQPIFKAIEEYHFPKSEQDDISESVTPLMVASGHGHYTIVKLLLSWMTRVSSQDAGATDLDTADSNGNTALHFASLWANREVIEALLKADSTLCKAKNNSGETPLYVACMKGNSAAVQILLDYGSDTTIADENGHMAIHHATWQGNLDSVKALIKANPDQLEVKNILGHTAFINACQAGHLELVEYFLDKTTANPTARNNSDETALYLAAWGGNLDIVKLLLQKGSQDLETPNDQRKTPLLIACLRSNFLVAEFLLNEKHVDCHVVDDYNDTALHLAVWGCNHQIVQILLEKEDWELDKQNKGGGTPLTNASALGYSLIVKLLIGKGADTSAVDAQGDTSLHLAAANGDVETVKFLLDTNKELVDKRNDQERTPLLVAGSCRSFEVVRILRDHDQDIHVVDTQGENILHKVIYDSQSDLVKWFLKRKVSIQQNIDGRTPLHFACYSNKIEAVDMLLDALAEDPKKRIEIINAKDRWGDTALTDAASEKKSHVVMQLLKDEGYFPQAPSSCSVDEIYFSDADERKRVNDLLLSEMETMNTNALGGEVDIDTDLTAVCYWATLNGCLNLVKSCVERANNKGFDFKLNREGTTWSHVVAMSRLNVEERVIISNLLPQFFGEEKKALCSDKQGITPLHVAVKHGNYELVENFLKKLGSNDQPDLFKAVLQQTTDDARDTPISLAAMGKTTKYRDIQSLLWESIEREADKHQIFSTPDLRSNAELLLELTARFDTRKNGRLLKRLLEMKTGAPERDNVFELAIRLQYPKVVWWLLSNGAYLNEGNIKRGYSILDSRKNRKDLKDDQIETLLGNPPPFMKHGPRSDDHRLPYVHSDPEDYKEFPRGTIVDLLHSEESGKTVFRFKQRSIAEIINLDGPQKIMASSQKGYDDFFSPAESKVGSQKSKVNTKMASKTQKAMYPSQERNPRAPGSSQLNDLALGPRQTEDPKRASQEPKHAVRWIHIPINDMNCLQNLVIRNSMDQNIKNEKHRPLLEFLQKSYSQLSAGSGKSYMKPQCLKRSGSAREPQGDHDGRKSDHHPPFALYIPLLSWTEKHSQSAENARKSLIRISQKNNIRQDYMTLDQYYYSSLPNTNERDEDQVLGRFLNRKTKEENQHKSRKILIVNQLWLWCLGHDTIITSTTEELDESKEGFLQCVLDNFHEQERHSEPSIDLIAELIVRTTVGLFQRKDITVPWSQKHPRSALDVFRESISNVRDAEKILFDRFSESIQNGNHKPKPSSQESLGANSHRSDKDRKNYSYSNISDETSYLREVKDICDELNILKNLAEDQERVWKDLCGDKQQVFDYDTPSEIKEEIEEMMKEAESVSKSLHTLLDLKQKQANIAEAQNSRDQSNTIMVFTVITILFLPATFLTSLFALNISVFSHQGGDVAYEGKWIFPIIMLVSLGTSGFFSLIAFYPKWIKYMNNKWDRGSNDEGNVQDDEAVQHHQEVPVNEDLKQRSPTSSINRRRGAYISEDTVSMV